MSAVAPARVSFPYTKWWSDGATVDLTLEGFHPDDCIAREIADRGTFFELDLLEHLAQFGPRGGIFVDVGANIGNHAVFFGKFLADHVVAVEPHPALQGILARNLDANGVPNASILPVALGAGRGVGRMTMHERRLNIGASCFRSGGEPEPASGDTVPLCSFDDAWPTDAPVRDRPVTLVKIDVEGMELEVLEGARHLLTAERPQLVIELQTERARASVGAFLGDFGYRAIDRRFCWTPTYHFIDPGRHRLDGIDRRTGVDPDVDRLVRISEALCRLVAAGQTLVLVDEETCWPGLVLDGRRRLPFLERDGNYWGPAADDATALAALERLRAGGAVVIAFVWSSFWWFKHYPGFGRALRDRFRCVIDDDDLVAFDLRAS